METCKFLNSRTVFECPEEAVYRIDTGHIETFACRRHLENMVRFWTVDFEEGRVIVNPVWKDRYNG